MANALTISREAEIHQGRASQDLSSQAYQSIVENIFQPFANAALIEPYDAVANTASQVTKPLGFELPQMKQYDVPKAELLSGQWLVQNVSSGLGMVIPYTIAGKLMGGAMRWAGASVGVEGATAGWLKSERLATIAGAAVFDGLRVTPDLPGSSALRLHLGNAAGGAGAFSIFMAGNMLAEQFGPEGRILARMATGAAGAAVQQTVADGIGQGRVPDQDHLFQAAISGAALNWALPAVQDGIGKAVDTANVRLNRGVPMDRYLGSLNGSPSERSPYFQQLLEENPWVRVQPEAKESLVTANAKRIDLASSDASPHKLAMLLFQHAQEKPGNTAEAQFQLARQQLEAGQIEQAKQTFMHTRTAQHVGVQVARSLINGEQTALPTTGRASAQELEAMAAALPSREVVRGYTYQEMFDREWDHFAATTGSYRPPVAYKEETDVTGTWQNQEMRRYYSSAYDIGKLDAIRLVLAQKGTINLVRYSTGGASAVTITDPRSAESALTTALTPNWDRDNILQALAEEAVSRHPELGNGTTIRPDQWKEGLAFGLRSQMHRQDRFLDIINDKASGFDEMRRPHIKKDPIFGNELNEGWGHAQNDALSFDNFLLFHKLNTGELDWNDPAIKPYAEGYATLLHHYFEKVHVWEDWDRGAWEDFLGEHQSSIGAAMESLREEAKFLQKHGPLSYEVNGQKFTVSESDVQEQLRKTEAKVVELGTNEIIRGPGGVTRDADAAQINPMILSAIAKRAYISDEFMTKVLNNVEEKLGRALGTARYKNDTWDGFTNRNDIQLPGQEAQWSHVSPMMSYIYGDLYRRTGNQQYFVKQVEHFNRSLGAVDPRWRVPEAYIVDRETRQWVPDKNEPLAWAQAMTLLSFDGMQQSLSFRDMHAPVSAVTAQSLPLLQRLISKFSVR